MVLQEGILRSERLADQAAAAFDLDASYIPGDDDDAFRRTGRY